MFVGAVDKVPEAAFHLALSCGTVVDGKGRLIRFLYLL